MRFPVATLFALVSSTVRADSELPDTYAVHRSALSKAVEILAGDECVKNSAAGGVALPWHIYRIPLRPIGSVFFVQCVFPASNDVHIVVLEDARGHASLPTFGHNVHAVYNARWDERNQIITDISGSGVGCAHERRWKWDGRNFVLVGQRIFGCR